MSKFPNWRFSQVDLDRVREVLASNFSASNPTCMCQTLEELWTKKIGAKHAITFTSGTATMHAGLDALGVKSGDEVIVPALGPIMTANAVVYQNAVPIFADVDENTFNIDPDDVRKKITERTKAIIPVSIYGLSPNFGEILEIAKEYDLRVIEDDAEAVGAKYDGKMLGTIGDVASFSFESSKTIAVGDLGLITTNDEELADKCRRFGSHGYSIGLRKVKDAKNVYQDSDYKRHITFGWAYRPAEVVCAIGISQVERLEHFVDLRIQIAKLYQETVEDCDEIGLLEPQWLLHGCKHVYWTYAVKFNGSKKEWRKFRKMYMKNGGDGVYACWSVPYQEPVYAGGAFMRVKEWNCNNSLSFIKWLKRVRCSVAEKIQPKIMQFPTNYGSIEEAKPKMEALAKTIREIKL